MHAMVTGGTRGLGRALVLALGERRWRVTAVARHGGDLVGDLGVAADVERIAAEAGEVELLIHNASTLGPVPLRPLLDLWPEELEATFAVNVFGPHRLTRALVGPMVLRGSGTIVTISSDAAVNRYPTWGPYGASKAAQDHLLGTLAAELEGTGVRFLSFDPGEMDTDMHAAAMPDADRGALAAPESVADRLLAQLGI